MPPHLIIAFAFGGDAVSAAWWLGPVLLGLWLFAMGASVGSFLNVVIYRLPAGLNLSHPGSRCPLCLHPIRLRDNIPVLGWLLLGGSCRDCQAPISPRYPLVESLVGLMALSLGLVEVLYLAGNLPDPPIYLQRASHISFTLETLALLVVLHVACLATITAAAFMQWDRVQVPGRLFLPLIVLALLATLVYPELRPIPAAPLSESLFRPLAPSASPRLFSLLSGLLDSLAALAILGAAGTAVRIAARRLARAASVREFPWPVALVALGLVGGWQWAAWVLAFGSCCWLGQTFLARLTHWGRGGTPAVWLLVANWAALLGWFLLHDLRWRRLISEFTRDFGLPAGLLAGGMLLASLAAAFALPDPERVLPALAPSQPIDAAEENADSDDKAAERTTLPSATADEGAVE
jgi:prepilin signal peptidase PulO-like enzyme (type II secretory pathway)